MRTLTFFAVCLLLVVARANNDTKSDEFLIEVNHRLEAASPKPSVKNLELNLCKANTDCKYPCTCQQFGESDVCFHDPVFYEAMSKCSVCLQDSGCPAGDSCFIIEGDDEGVCTGCLSRSIDSGVNACPANKPPAGGPANPPRATAKPAPATAAPTPETGGPADSADRGPGVVAPAPAPVEEETEPEESPEDDGSSVCFPATARVTLEDGTEKMIKDVEINDKIRTGNNKYSTVFSFTHRDSTIKYRFVELSTRSGRKVQLTGSHFIYANGVPTAAKNVQVGDELMGAEGVSDVVVSIVTVSNTGLFNPQTMDGDIVVDGLVSSTYTEAIQFEAAHTLLAPLRMLYRVCGAAPLMLEKSIA